MSFTVSLSWSISCFGFMMLFNIDKTSKESRFLRKYLVRVLTDYNEPLPCWCATLGPSCRPTPPPRRGPGNSTRTPGSRKLEHKDTREDKKLGLKRETNSGRLSHDQVHTVCLSVLISGPHPESYQPPASVPWKQKQSFPSKVGWQSIQELNVYRGRILRARQCHCSQ